MQKPSVGRIVHVFADPAQNNGADISPAIITRVWGTDPGSAVNVRVFADGAGVPWLTSIPLYPDREAAQAFVDKSKAEWKAMGDEAYPYTIIAAFWPPRTS